MFWKPKDSMKSKCYVFLAVRKKTNEVCLRYSECKLRQFKYESCIFKLKWHKTVKRTYLETGKQQKKYA